MSCQGHDTNCNCTGKCTPSDKVVSLVRKQETWAFWMVTVEVDVRSGKNAGRHTRTFITDKSPVQVHLEAVEADKLANYDGHFQVSSIIACWETNRAHLNYCRSLGFDLSYLEGFPHEQPTE